MTVNGDSSTVFRLSDSPVLEVPLSRYGVLLRFGENRDSKMLNLAAQRRVRLPRGVISASVDGL